MKTISLLTFVVIVTDRKSEYYITRFPTDDIKRLTLLGDDARSGTELGLGRPRWWLPLWPAIGWATSGTPGDLSPRKLRLKPRVYPGHPSQACGNVEATDHAAALTTYHANRPQPRRIYNHQEIEVDSSFFEPTPDRIEELKRILLVQQWNVVYLDDGKVAWNKSLLMRKRSA